MNAIDPQSIRLMRLVIASAIASRRKPVDAAIEEARSLCRGLHPGLPMSMLDEAVADLARELGVSEPRALLA